MIGNKAPCVCCLLLTVWVAVPVSAEPVVIGETSTIQSEILDEERVDNIMRQTPMARFGEPHELVGAALLLLARNAGSFVTGSAVYVDGGFTAMRF